MWEELHTEFSLSSSGCVSVSLARGLCLCPLLTECAGPSGSPGHAWAVQGGGHVLRTCCRHCCRVFPGRLDVMRSCREGWVLELVLLPGEGMGSLGGGHGASRRVSWTAVGRLAPWCPWVLLLLLSPPPAPTHHPMRESRASEHSARQGGADECIRLGGWLCGAGERHGLGHMVMAFPVRVWLLIPG